MVSQISNFLTTADAVIFERRKIENIRLDLDSVKAALKNATTVAEQNRLTLQQREQQEIFNDAQAIFKANSFISFTNYIYNCIFCSNFVQNLK